MPVQGLHLTTFVVFLIFDLFCNKLIYSIKTVNLLSKIVY